MAELRWILLGLGLLLIGGIWWRGARKSSQAHDKAELRGGAADGAAARAAGTADGTPAPAAGAAAAPEQAISEVVVSAGGFAARGTSPLDPLSIKTADFEHVPILDMPMLAETAPADHQDRFDYPDHPDRADSPVQPAEPARPAEETPSALDGVKPRTDNSGRFAPVAPPRVNASELQKIVSLRICALGNGRWTGQQLIDALELQGLAYGRYQVFHRNHVDGRSLFCVASLVEPGTFDLEQMAAQEFRGITAFAVLPGPLEPLQTFESLIATARRLAESLTAIVQDGKGVPLSPQRAAVLRDEVARFQAMLP